MRQGVETGIHVRAVAGSVEIECRSWTDTIDEGARAVALVVSRRCVEASVWIAPVSVRLAIVVMAYPAAVVDAKPIDLVSP